MSVIIKKEHIAAYNGVIGKSGTFYPCGINQHIPTCLAHKDDAPFVEIKTHFGDTHVVFEAGYCYEPSKPTRAQFETVMEWCKHHEQIFEDVTEVWYLPWLDWRADPYD